jgi:transposase
MTPYKYYIHLNGKEKQELRQLNKAGKTERRLADRARIILWTNKRLAVNTIATRLECHRSTVINWRRWFLKRRTNGQSAIECLQDAPRSGRPVARTPLQEAQIKAIVCERPALLEQPLSRFSLSEILAWVEEADIVPQLSLSTLWRLLHDDAIRPWLYRTWLFPRDPDFKVKAERVVDLYHRQWQGVSLGEQDYVISADEKSGLQVLERRHPTVLPQPGRAGLVEFEYKRHGTVAYLAALDVFRAKVFGQVGDTTGIVPFGHLVDEVMQQEPYASARRVFWILDNGSSHHPNTSPARLQAAYPNLIAVHLPIHASWLNQIEIYFSILQRKALTPMDMADREVVKERILEFQDHYNKYAKPFNWKFGRDELNAWLKKLKSKNL